MEWSPRARSNCTLQRCVRACARAPAVGYLQSCSGLMQETQFDTSAAEITCVQTVIALQTIRTAITHFLKVNTLKQGGSARPEITLQKTHQGEPRGETGGEGEDRQRNHGCLTPNSQGALALVHRYIFCVFLPHYFLVFPVP